MEATKKEAQSNYDMTTGITTNKTVFSLGGTHALSAFENFMSSKNDYFGRNLEKQLGVVVPEDDIDIAMGLKQNYTHKNLPNNKTTNQVESVSNSYGYSATVDDEYVEEVISTKQTAYTYDNKSNISTITIDNLLAHGYTYDKANQLVREDNAKANKTYFYTYDKGGNIVSKKTYAYTTGTLGALQDTINYSYTDTNRKDKPTSYNGTAIIYDAIGNPLNYVGKKEIGRYWM